MQNGLRFPTLPYGWVGSKGSSYWLNSSEQQIPNYIIFKLSLHLSENFKRKLEVFKRSTKIVFFSRFGPSGFGKKATKKVTEASEKVTEK